MKLKSMLVGVLALACACAFGGETKESAVAQKLQTCDFLLNKDFKKNAKYYLCLFSASWCGPCRREMPRIAKTYAETLKADPDIELIHFSRDQNDDKALSWAKEHDVKFPVVKPKGGNPLNLHSRGIPHIFIVKADGTLVNEGHPMRLFTDENLRLLKTGKFNSAENAIVPEKPSKPETATEKTRKAIAKLFPGWELDSEIDQHPLSGFHSSHRGQNNVLFIHPKSTEVPAIISRTMKLSGKNPCLFLKVASWCENSDYLLSVRVNGKEALPNRLVSTMDSEPWQDIVVSLADWRGLKVKVEIVIAANNWWRDASFISRIEISEGKGDMRLVEGKTTINGYTWSYRAQNGEATIIAEKDGKFSRAVSPRPIGHLEIPSTVDGIKVVGVGRDAFNDCSGMTSVTIPEGVTRIGRKAFEYCTGLRSVNVPSGVKTIGWDAFGACHGMTSVTLPEGLKIVDRGAFWDCYALTSIAMPSTVTYLGQAAFLRCRSLRSVSITSGITDIGWRTFRGCNALTSMTIPASVTNVRHTAFCDTGAMTLFRVEDGNRFYRSENDLLLTKDGTTLARGVNSDVKIPSSVTTIGKCAFEGSVSLRSVVIPSGVKSISDFAFKQCRGLTSVTIPASVTNIGFEAFNNCREISSVTLCGEKPAVANSAFAGCGRLSAIHVPANAKSWAGMKEWLGKPLVFDAKEQTPYHARTFDQTRKEVAKLFPGWSLDTEVQQLDIRDADSGFCVAHRGQKNVILLHPVGEGKSAILSRSMKLSNKDSFLSLKVASYAEKMESILCDFLLSVRVNGKDVLSNRRICTPDSAPWEDVSVQLSAWRGQNVKIEVVLTADGWWYEFPYLARLEVCEGDGEDKATSDDLYCVIDISGGANAKHYPISFLDAIPQGGWGKEYKMDKIVLRRIDAGTYPTMIRRGVNRLVTFTKPFYMGIFELTQKQIKLLSGERKFVYEGDMRPADCLCYEEMRGMSEEFNYPSVKDVAADSVIGKLRSKTGIDQIDLPTSYQFGCVWNAGTDGNGWDARADGRHASNRQDGRGGFKAKHTTVGSYQPNEWGFYDLHGNVWEICVNRTDDEKAGIDVDPEGPTEGERRSVRGGGWNSADAFISAEEIPSTRKGEADNTARPPTGMSGCRIVINTMPHLSGSDVNTNRL